MAITIGTLGVLLGAWELYVDLSGVDSTILAAPHQIAHSLIVDRGLLARDLLVTAQEVALGIALASVVGPLLAVAIHLIRPLRAALYPLIVASQAIPIPVLALPLTLLFGFGILPKALIAALVSFFSIVVATLDALSAVDPQLIKLMQTFDASRLRVLREIELPAALPGVFTGAKIAVAVSVIGAVIGEMSGISSSGSAGLGTLFLQSINQLQGERAWAIAVVLSLFAMLLFGLLGLLERLALPWAHETDT